MCKYPAFQRERLPRRHRAARESPGLTPTRQLPSSLYLFSQPLEVKRFGPPCYTEVALGPMEKTIQSIV